MALKNKEIQPFHAVIITIRGSTVVFDSCAWREEEARALKSERMEKYFEYFRGETTIVRLVSLYLYTNYTGLFVSVTKSSDLYTFATVPR